MIWKRAAHYTRKAFLTFLLVSIPGLFLQVGIEGLFAAWKWMDGGSPVSSGEMAALSIAQRLGALWVQFAILFVVFKYLPVAILEVQENREAKRVDGAARTAKNLKQYPS